MANPQYIHTLSGSPLTGTTVTLPRPPMWGRGKGREEHNIVHRTNRIKMWKYRLAELRTRKYVFRFPESEYDNFEQFHIDVQGEMTPFYWIYESETLLVWKEPGFDPVPFEQPYTDGSVAAHWYDYTLILIEDSPGLSILA